MIIVSFRPRRRQAPRLKVLRAKVPEGGFRAREDLVLEEDAEGGGREERTMELLEDGEEEWGRRRLGAWGAGGGGGKERERSREGVEGLNVSLSPCPCEADVKGEDEAGDGVVRMAWCRVAGARVSSPCRVPAWRIAGRLQTLLGPRELFG